MLVTTQSALNEPSAPSILMSQVELKAEEGVPGESDFSKLFSLMRLETTPETSTPLLTAESAIKRSSEDQTLTPLSESKGVAFAVMQQLQQLRQSPSALEGGNNSKTPEDLSKSLSAGDSLDSLIALNEGQKSVMNPLTDLPKSSAVEVSTLELKADAEVSSTTLPTSSDKNTDNELIATLNNATMPSDGLIQASNLSQVPASELTSKEMPESNVLNTVSTPVADLEADVKSPGMTQGQMQTSEPMIKDIQASGAPGEAPVSVADLEARVKSLVTSDSVVQAPANELLTQSALDKGVSSAASASVTSWGTQVSSAAANATNGDTPMTPQSSQAAGQSGQGGNGQPTQGQAGQQQSMMFAELMRGEKVQSREQQAVVKALDESNSKTTTDGKELLGADVATSERRGALPLGLQAIPQPLKHPQWNQALGQRVVFMATNSLQQAQITLNPEKLGHIQVTLQLDKDQKMNVSLNAQNGTTREAIESAMPKLREMLEQAGLTLGSMDVGDQKSFADTHKDKPAHAGIGSNGSTEETMESEAQLSIVKTSDYIIDYYA